MTNYSIREYEKRLRKEGLTVKSHFPENYIEDGVEYISYDSKDVKPGTLFVCKGLHFKPDYLVDALEAGAFGYVSEKEYPGAGLDIPYIIVNDIKRAMPLIADMYYDQIWKKIKLVGITGTKGKSSAAYYMKYILDDYLSESGREQSAIISGIDNYDGVINEESHLTTPEAMMLHKHFDNAVSSGIEYLSMEVSSQALKYYRTEGIVFDVACFLNLGKDHISDIEHSSVEDYAASKLIFFDQCRVACINMDDPRAGEFVARAKKSQETQRIITFGMRESADINAHDIDPSRSGITFTAKGPDFDEEIHLGMPGLFNVYNALCAISASYALDIPFKNIKAGLASAKVSGRMEVFESEGGPVVFVDYAHNQMSFQTLFDAIKEEYKGKKIFIVFGCPGKKALGRRKELGDIAGMYADKCFITEEDAGEEPVMDISREIVKHIEEQGGISEIIIDRREAIRKALTQADEDTVVLITGKGRETRQKRGTEYITTPSDVDYVEEFLREESK